MALWLAVDVGSGHTTSRPHPHIRKRHTQRTLHMRAEREWSQSNHFFLLRYFSRFATSSRLKGHSQVVLLLIDGSKANSPRVGGHASHISTHISTHTHTLSLYCSLSILFLGLIYFLPCLFLYAPSPFLLHRRFSITNYNLANVEPGKQRLRKSQKLMPG